MKTATIITSADIKMITRLLKMEQSKMYRSHRTDWANKKER